MRVAHVTFVVEFAEVEGFFHDLFKRRVLGIKLSIRKLLNNFIDLLDHRNSRSKVVYYLLLKESNMFTPLMSLLILSHRLSLTMIDGGSQVGTGSRANVILSLKFFNQRYLY